MLAAVLELIFCFSRVRLFVTSNSRSEPLWLFVVLCSLCLCLEVFMLTT
jgi:hypothetical protein